MDIQPIAYAKTPFKEKFGIPRQSGRTKVRGKIILDKHFDLDSVRMIEGFSHLWLIFDFSLAHRNSPSQTVRPPRLGGNERVGVFASRSPYRPNSLGLSLVKLASVEQTTDGITLNVEGIDLVDGTPIYDIKPYLASDNIEDAKYGYSTAHNTHFLQVENAQILDCVDNITKEEIISCIQEDPRPSYQDDDRIYGMRFDSYNIKFSVENGVAKIIAIEVKN